MDIQTQQNGQQQVGNAGWMKNIVSMVIEYKKQVIVGIIFAGCLSCVVVGYHFYKRNLQVKAHQTLIGALKYYEAPVKVKRDETDFSSLQFTSEKEKWTKVEEAFRDAYQNYKSSTLAPMFLAYQADALLNLDKHEEALKVLQNAIDLMDNENVADFYRVKLALMQMDSSQENLRQEGFGLLKKLAETQQSIAQEKALYHIGGYYWSQKKYAEAQNYWNQLLLKFDRDPKIPSVYAESVKSKLRLITAEQ